MAGFGPPKTPEEIRAGLEARIMSAHRIRAGVKVTPSESKMAAQIIDQLGISVRLAIQPVIQLT